MKQELDLDTIIRQRIRGLRAARGWSLDTLAARCFLSPSTLSRIETGHRRIALDQLVPIARALGSSLDQLVETTSDEDVVIRPRTDRHGGMTIWSLAGERTPNGLTVAKMRITTTPQELAAEPLRVHSGREWFTVISGTAHLALGDRVILVETGEAAEFSTMLPHGIAGYDGPVELLTILNREGEAAHVQPVAEAAAAASRSA